MQELLDHAFLHPNRPRAPPPGAGPSLGGGAGGVDPEQLRAIVAQVAAAAGAGADVEAITRRVISQLAGGGGGG